MVDINWNIFKAKFNERESISFEKLAYHLFCSEFDIKNGLFGYKNQAGIEKEPIQYNNDLIGFQAKYYETKLADNKNDIIDSIKKAKSKNPKLTKILFYLNKEFSESSLKDKKEPQLKIEIEKEASKLNLQIEWRVPSHFEIQLALEKNKELAEFFFVWNGNIIDSSDSINKETAEQLFEKNKTEQNIELKKIIENSNLNQTNEIISKFGSLIQNISFQTDLDLLNKHFVKEIDNIKLDIDNNNVDSALRRLINLKDSEWENANKDIKFRILTNIGVIYTKINKLEEAAKYFIHAFDIQPEGKNAVNNIFSALIFLNDNNINIELKGKIQSTSIELSECLAIRFERQNQTLEEIEKSLNDNYTDSENILMALAYHAHITNRPDKTIEYYRKVLLKNENIIHNENLANSILVKFINYPFLAFKFSNKLIEKELIKEGIDLYEKCWYDYEKGEIRKYKAEIKAKQAILYSLIGDLSNAKIAIDIALKEDENDEFFNKYKALILTSNGENEEAIKIFSTITNFELHSDVPISYAICLHNTSKTNEAIKILNDFIYLNIQNHFQRSAVGLILDIYIQTKQYPEALKLLESNSNFFGDDNNSLLYKSRVLFYNGEVETAKEILNKVITNFKDDDLRISVFIANVLEEQNRKEEAIDFYLKSIDLNQNNEFTNRMAWLYIEINRKDKALEIYRNLRDRYGVIKGVTRNEISIIQEKGELEVAKKIMSEYLIKFPEDFELELNLANLNIKIGKPDENKNFLNNEIDYLSLNIKQFTTYLNLLAQNGCIEKARQYIYEAWRQFDTAEYNDLFMFFYIQYPLNPINIKQYNEVEIDCFVELEDENKRVLQYILTHYKKNELIRRNKEINEENQLFGKLFGKKIGDYIEITNNFLNEKFKIIKITHKYIYALSKAENLIGSTYIGESQLKLFSFEKFEQIIENEKNRQIEIEIQEKEYTTLYYDRKIPLGFFARFFNNSPINIWYYFTKSDKKIICSNGFQNEFSDVINIIEDSNINKILFIDIYSLFTLYNLKSKEIILKEFEIFICPETENIIEKHIQELKSNTNYDSFSLIFRNNQQYKIEEPLKSKQENLDYFKEIQSWVKSNIFVRTSDTFIKNNHKQENLLKDVFGLSTYHTFLLAKENKGIAYIDDLASREFIGMELKVTGIWTQAILVYLNKKEHLSNDFYIDDIIQLANLNYHFTSITKDVLIGSIKQSGYRISSPFLKVTKILRGNTSSDTSLIIAFSFLIDILKNEDISVQIKEEITTYTISEILLYRTIIEVYENLYFIFLRDVIISEKEVEFIFKILRTHIENSGLGEVIEKHPLKFRRLRKHALLALNNKKNR